MEDLVLGTLRLNCSWEYDKLQEIANNHKTLREFLSHTIYEFDQRYGLQTLKDNISLFTPGGKRGDAPQFYSSNE